VADAAQPAKPISGTRGPNQPRQQNIDSESFNKFGPASPLAAVGVPCTTMTWCPTDSSR